MIKIHVSYHDDVIDKIMISGHALYDDYGRDIVCASVSSTYLCTVNAIFALHDDSIYVYDEDDKQEIQVLKVEHVVQVLLQNMIRCFESLEKQYPNNIKLDKEEE